MCENGCGTAGATTAVAESDAPQSRWVGGSGVDDLQAQAVVDQLLHRHQPARVVEGIRGSDELYEFLQRPHDTGRFLERTGFTD